MKLFQKTSVAVALTVVMIAAAIGIGQVRGSSAPAVPQAAGLDKSLSTSSYATWISDEAEVLSDQEEQQICLYNANWVARYDSLIAVATVREVSGDIADYAYALGEQIQLGAADGILVVDTGTNNCYLAVGPDYPMTDEQVTSHLDRYLYENAMAGQFGTGVLSLFDGINQFYVENYGLGYLETSQNAYGGRSTGEAGHVSGGAAGHPGGHCQRGRSSAVYLLPAAVLWGAQSSLSVPAHPVLARARLWLVPAPLAQTASPAPQTSKRAWRLRRFGWRLQRFPGAQRGLRLRWIFQWLPGRGLLPRGRLWRRFPGWRLRTLSRLGSKKRLRPRFLGSVAVIFFME